MHSLLQEYPVIRHYKRPYPSDFKDVRLSEKATRVMNTPFESRKSAYRSIWTGERIDARINGLSIGNLARYDSRLEPIFFVPGVIHTIGHLAAGAITSNGEYVDAPGYADEWVIEPLRRNPAYLTLKATHEDGLLQETLYLRITQIDGLIHAADQAAFFMKLSDIPVIIKQTRAELDAAMERRGATANEQKIPSFAMQR